jgi:hypothetical protein
VTSVIPIICLASSSASWADFGQLDAAAFTAPAGMDLSFDDHDVTAEPPRDLAHFRRSKRHLAARHGNAKAREH